ncbi:hypothetical protein LIER_41066 [Lithospermum erythrorhizon]|uniref:Uncharacterized protein n=1 Tax=Lithospermum erythrorhizon TaxID=34254 RepID=A0AAV3R6Z6_LITER
MLIARALRRGLPPGDLTSVRFVSKWLQMLLPQSLSLVLTGFGGWTLLSEERLQLRIVNEAALDRLLNPYWWSFIGCGLGTALRLAMEFCHEWSVRRVVHRAEANVGLRYHPAL